MNIWHARPFVPLLLIEALIFVIPHDMRAWIIPCISCLLWVIYAIRRFYLHIKWDFIPYFFLCVICLTTDITFHELFYQSTIAPIDSRQIDFQLIVKEVQRSGKNKIIASFQAEDREQLILLTFPSDFEVADLRSGDIINADLQVQGLHLEPSADAFDYDRYLLHQHILYTGKVSAICKLPNSVRHRSMIPDAQSMSLLLKKNIHCAIRDSATAGLMIAILLGDRAEVSENIESQFIASGTAHILAVSGMHIGMLYAILNFIFRKGKKENKRRLLFSQISILLAIWLFAWITGLGVSVERAAIMFTLSEIGRWFRRKPDPVNILCATAFLILASDPCMLYDAGLQLSFWAVMSILLFYPVMQRAYYTGSKWINYFLDTTYVSLSVQCLVTPVSIFYFQAFPTYFLISNLYWVPVSFALMLCGLLIMLLPFIPLLTGVAGACCVIGITQGLNLFEQIQNWPFPQLSELPMDLVQAVVLIASFICIHQWIMLKHMYWLFCCILLLCFFNIQPVIRHALTSSNVEIVLYNKRFDPVMDIRNGGVIYSYRSPELATSGETYYEKSHSLCTVKIIPNSFNQCELLRVGNDKNQWIIALDSIPNDKTLPLILFIHRKKFSKEEIQQSNAKSVMVLHHTNAVIRNYYQQRENECKNLLHWAPNKNTIIQLN